MTVSIKIGRRVPKSFFRRGVHKLAGLISFQENIWIIIKQSLNLARKKCTQANNGMKFIIVRDEEMEDLFYKIEWMVVTIQGSKAQEQEEYEQSMKLYTGLGKIFKKEFPKEESDKLKSMFKTKLLSEKQLTEAYKAGYGSMGDNNIANKLLEMGIMTHIELIDDVDVRVSEFSPVIDKDTDSV